MKSKDDKSEDGSDQEREYLEYDYHSLPPPARSVHVLALFTVFYVFFLAVCTRLYLYQRFNR